MFGNLGTHLMQFPTGRWGFVGSIPTVLCTEIPATTADVLGCRTHTGPDGKPWAWKTPSFATKGEALAHAATHNVTVKE